MEVTLLPEIFLTRKPLLEHHQYYYKDAVIPLEEQIFCKEEIYFKGKMHNDFCCFRMVNGGKPNTSYFIGVDWLSKSKVKAIYVQPKLNKNNEQVDYIKMLFSALRHPETLKYIDDLYEIKWVEKPIEIEEQLDHLTPLLVVQFLQIMQRIVRKGLKKSYYKVEKNLLGKVKGKVMITSTIKHNLVKNKTIHTYCSFEEFGVNGVENKLLKKALTFVQRYLHAHRIESKADIGNVFNYINPAFADVSDEVSLHGVNHTKSNVFYKEYEDGIKLAKRILKRFGYNIANTEKQQKIKTPPFWIDMSKLFELYVLGLLKDRYLSDLHYHYYSDGNELDYLLNSGDLKAVIDAKYKLIYDSSYKNYDIRQLSGYARNRRVLTALGFKTIQEQDQTVIDCIIIYPDQSKPESLPEDLKNDPISEYAKFYKVPIKLPTLTKDEYRT